MTFHSLFPNCLKVVSWRKKRSHLEELSVCEELFPLPRVDVLRQLVDAWQSKVLLSFQKLEENLQRERRRSRRRFPQQLPRPLVRWPSPPPKAPPAHWGRKKVVKAFYLLVGVEHLRIPPNGWLEIRSSSMSTEHHLASSQEPKKPVKLGGSSPILILMTGVSTSRSLGQLSRYSRAILTLSCCSWRVERAPNQAKTEWPASRIITSSSGWKDYHSWTLLSVFFEMVKTVPMRSSWLKSTTSSTVMLPVALGCTVKLCEDEIGGDKDLFV